MVADYITEGAVRAYARVDPKRRGEIKDNATARELLGGGTLALTIDPQDQRDRYQGVVALEGESLAEAVEGYFRQSEQIPTRVRAAVGRFQAAGLPRWRGGGMIMQQIAGDITRGDAEDAWNTASILFETLTDAELIDPDLSGGRVLFRLFHETGVRLFEPTKIRRYCQCSQERVKSVLGSFPASEREAMQESGTISATCEYCYTTYRFTAADFSG
jgi:molecular chaperone Hsp33